MYDLIVRRFFSGTLLINGPPSFELKCLGTSFGAQKQKVFNLSGLNMAAV